MKTNVSLNRFKKFSSKCRKLGGINKQKYHQNGRFLIFRAFAYKFSQQ